MLIISGTLRDFERFFRAHGISRKHATYLATKMKDFDGLITREECEPVLKAESLPHKIKKSIQDFLAN